MTAEINYETDFYQWTQQQAALLRQGEFNRVDLDFENIAEEIESMGRREKHSIRSYLFNIVMHLLKWHYQPERRGNSWKLSIFNGRHQMFGLLEESPSLKPQLETLLAKEYPQARKVAALETGLPLATFPKQCPFTLDQITDDYWPD
ncbi:DUF29 domain-containing protein [Candidatus Contendibacter odensensis]|uniref:DUF29 domain-containing protein n=1 Tax=Candidatus Contendobacter odensis Run_B_J11 TaxID=1400861 RepID=A0A7U7GG37_9GAMM|nr:DUF29 domain-containing protein [Candidatus Contendobacter odensis]CDH47658.1 conserved hypothetical protein [Candidatus Contendobacter odensis Run_B_J11]